MRRSLDLQFELRVLTTRGGLNRYFGLLDYRYQLSHALPKSAFKTSGLFHL